MTKEAPREDRSDFDEDTALDAIELLLQQSELTDEQRRRLEEMRGDLMRWRRKRDHDP